MTKLSLPDRLRQLEVGDRLYYETTAGPVKDENAKVHTAARRTGGRYSVNRFTAVGCNKEVRHLICVERLE